MKYKWVVYKVNPAMHTLDMMNMSKDMRMMMMMSLMYIKMKLKDTKVSKYLMGRD
jgi:hypothetical protein